MARARTLCDTGPVDPMRGAGMSMLRPILMLALMLAVPVAAPAAVWHVAPGADGKTADGSAAHPYATVAGVFRRAPVAGGDTIRLAPGDHGALRLTDVGFDTPVTLLSDPGAPARFTRVWLENTRNIILDGAAVRPPPGARTEPVAVEESGAGNVLRNLDVRGVLGADKYRAWPARRWLREARDGVRMRGRDATLENSRITGVVVGIALIGPDGRILDNAVRGFSGDAIRAVGQRGLVRGNYVTDCFKVDGNHDDAFQSWSRGPDGRPGKGTIDNLVIEANMFLEWSGPLDEADHPLRCALQGIGMFDGMFRNLVIRNNFIAVNAYHGIAVSGLTNARIVNNTVINARGISRERPWITISNHRDGQASNRNVVANNIAPRFLYRDSVRDRNILAPNAVVIYPHRELAFDPTLPRGVEVGLKPGSKLRGTADPAHAPDTDRRGRPRSQPPDPGADQGPAAP